MKFPMSTATGVIDRMVEGGWVCRDRSLKDRRVVEVRLTKRGREALRQKEEMGMAFCDAILNALDEKDQNAMLDILQKAARNVRFERNL